MQSKSMAYAYRVGLLCAGASLCMVVHAEYCLNYSSGVKSLASQAGSGSFRGCVPTEAQCNAARLSRPGDYSGMCYYVPGAYPPTSGATNHGSVSGVEQTGKSSLDAQKKILSQKQAEQAAIDQAAQHAGQALLRGGLKGFASSDGGLSIKVPQSVATGAARKQLDCVQRSSAAARAEAMRSGGEPNASFEVANDCRAITPEVPDASPPVPVEAVDGIPKDPASLASFLSALQRRLSTAQRALTAQDQEVKRLESSVNREEQRAAKSSEAGTAQPASDALRKAQEALAKAKADRQQTANDIQKMQAQEREAQSALNP